MAFHVPWWIFDLQNKQLITTPTIPSGKISDTKNIVLAETKIPGLSYDPITPGGMGNRKISFTMTLVRKDNVVGNLLLLKQFENLRNQSFGFGFKNIFTNSVQFTPNTKVLFFWGSGNEIPLEYFVSKCDFSHDSAFVNRLGKTQYTDVTLELILDEQSPIYKAEEVYRKISSYLGMALGSVDTTASLGGRNTNLVGVV